MGVVFSQKSSLIPDVTVRDNLRFYGAMYDIQKREFENLVGMLEKFFNLTSSMDKPVRKLSFGQRMKVELTSVLLHKPKYIFLDEPTIGLDIFVKEELLNLLKKYNEQFNSTIIIITHEVEFLKNICSRVIILDSGKMILDKSPKEIHELFNNVKNFDVVYKSIIDNVDFKEVLKKFYETVRH